MNAPAVQPPPLPKPRPPIAPEKALRRLFLTLFLRGRSARGLRKDSAPTSIGRKLLGSIAVYAFFGIFALGFVRQPVFSLAIYLHGMTFVFLGMFVAASAGEVLFNKEEADILMHRPIAPRALLWAKIRVLVEVSLWLAGAFNLVGFFVGAVCRDGNWIFPFAHVASTILEALLCTGTVVLIYQLCLRWFGRERLEGLMTMAQMLIAVLAVTAGQIVPRLISHPGASILLDGPHWWIVLLPPAWFAGFDETLVNGGNVASWMLALVALLSTAAVLYFAFGKLANSYEAGVQALNESSTRKPKRGRTRRRFLDVLVNAPPLRWWLREPVARAAFLLSAAYLARDREVKLRVYPGLAPMLVLPFVFLFQDRQNFMGSFGAAFTGAYLGLIPMIGLDLLRYSQQWQAADLFRNAPIAGPAQLCHGARRAVLVFLTLPLLLLFTVIIWLLHGQSVHWVLAIPGLLALPIYAMIPCVGGNAVPFSVPSAEAKSASRGIQMFGIMIIAMILALAAQFAWKYGWFWWLVLAEFIVVSALYFSLRASVTAARWQSID